jgi:mono/diheme cytochrome c family protein
MPAVRAFLVSAGIMHLRAYVDVSGDARSLFGVGGVSLTLLRSGWPRTRPQTGFWRLGPASRKEAHMAKKGADVLSKRGILIALGALAVGVIAVVVTMNWPAKTRADRLLRPEDARFLVLGQKVYAAQCAACHGQRLEGQPNWRERGADGRLPAPPHDASGHTWHHPDELLFRITKYGVAKAANLKNYESAMPAYEDRLSDEEIVAVLSWIKSTWPPEIRARADHINAEASR